MNEQELKQDYELLGLTLCQNLREYGDLTPPGATADILDRPRAYAAADKKFSPFSNGENMLRLEAYLKESNSFYPYFLDPTDFVPRLPLKEDARPLFLQQEAEDGSFDLVPYYPVSDFSSIPQDVLSAIPRESSELRDFFDAKIDEIGAEKAFCLCFHAKDSGEDRSPAALAKDFAEKWISDCSPLDVELFAAVAQKAFRLPAASPDHPLFPEQTIRSFEADPSKMVHLLHPSDMVSALRYVMLLTAQKLKKAEQEKAAEAAPPKRFVIYDYLCKKSDLPHFQKMLADDGFVDWTASPPLDTYAVYPPMLEGKFQDTIASTAGDWGQVDLPKASTAERSAVPNSMAWFSSTRPPEEMTEEPVLVAMPGDELRTLKEIGNHSYDAFSAMDKPDCYREAGAYYLSYANLLAPEDPQDSDQTLLACAVAKMKKDGIGKDDMEYILKASPKPELAESLHTVLNAGKSPAR